MGVCMRTSILHASSITIMASRRQVELHYSEVAR
jgi:hypothetical protein